MAYRYLQDAYDDFMRLLPVRNIAECKLRFCHDWTNVVNIESESRRGETDCYQRNAV